MWMDHIVDLPMYIVNSTLILRACLSFAFILTHNIQQKRATIKRHVDGKQSNYVYEYTVQMQTWK